jgi:predicted nucleic acid-binding protein
MVRKELVTWISSSVLNLEISHNPDPERRRSAEALLAFSSEIFIPNSATADLARRIEELGIAPFDALHLAAAEQSEVNVFLTTDDNLLRRARRGRGLLRIRVQKPVSWIREVQS